MTKNNHMSNDYVLRRANIVGTPDASKTKGKQPTKPQGPSFQEVLGKVQQSDQEVKFSKHALARLENRNIHLNKADVEKINAAVDKAQSKGIKEALILMDNKAFIASVKNRTIITAAAEDQLKDQVFTNIDGAVIV